MHSYSQNGPKMKLKDKVKVETIHVRDRSDQNRDFKPKYDAFLTLSTKARPCDKRDTENST